MVDTKCFKVIIGVMLFSPVWKEDVMISAIIAATNRWQHNI